MKWAFPAERDRGGNPRAGVARRQAGATAAATTATKERERHQDPTTETERARTTPIESAKSDSAAETERESYIESKDIETKPIRREREDIYLSATTERERKTTGTPASNEACQMCKCIPCIYIYMNLHIP